MTLNALSEILASTSKPVIQHMYSKAGKQLTAIGLKSGVALPEDISILQSKLIVVQGEIDVNTETHSYRLERFDAFDIPVNLKHTVVGVFDAIFLLFTKENN